jgi:Fur family ferric uptake transcriptional regulator
MSLQKRDTKQKKVIWSIVEEAGRPLSPTEVHQEAAGHLPRLSLSTVYRTIKSLQAEQRIVAVSLPGAADRYETKSLADHHHHHFHCDGCGRVFDIPGCGLRVDAGLPKGFSLSRHEVVLYGSCGQCS